MAKEFEGKLVKNICVTEGYGRTTKIVSAHMEIKGIHYVDIGRKISLIQDKETGESHEGGKAGYIDPADAKVHCEAVLEYLKTAKFPKTPRTETGSVTKTSSKLDLSDLSKLTDAQKAQILVALGVIKPEAPKKSEKPKANSESLADLGEVAIANLLTNTKNLNSIANKLKRK